MCVFNIYILHQTPSGVTSLENKPGLEPDYLTFKLVGNKWLQTRTKKQLIIGTLITMLIVLSVAALIIVLLTTQNKKQSTDEPSEELEVNKPNPDPEDPDAEFIITPPKLIDRLTWLAVPEQPGVILLKTPVPYVVIHHTATEPCYVLAGCKSLVQSIQRFHMKSNNWSDIAYNYLVGGDGNKYEGRGWTKQGAHVKGYNNVSIGIAFIGLFNDNLPPKRQMLAAQDLIKEGLELGFIREDYKLLAMRQLSTFKSPGRALYDKIKTWPHWSPTL